MGELLVMSPFHGLGLSGIAMFVGTHALLASRVIRSDGLAFFSGNTVAAALVLSSNFGGFHIAWLLAQVVLIALALTAMIALFFKGDDHG